MIPTPPAPGRIAEYGFSSGRLVEGQRSTPIVRPLIVALLFEFCHPLWPLNCHRVRTLVCSMYASMWTIQELPQSASGAVAGVFHGALSAEAPGGKAPITSW